MQFFGSSLLASSNSIPCTNMSQKPPLRKQFPHPGRATPFTRPWVIKLEKMAEESMESLTLSRLCSFTSSWITPHDPSAQAGTLLGKRGKVKKGIEVLEENGLVAGFQAHSFQRHQVFSSSARFGNTSCSSQTVCGEQPCRNTRAVAANVQGLVQLLSQLHQALGRRRFHVAKTLASKTGLQGGCRQSWAEAES